MRQLKDKKDPVYLEVDKRPKTMHKLGASYFFSFETIMKESTSPFSSYLSMIYPVPKDRFQAKINFTKASAMWSMVGMIINLGDRHPGNILLD